MTDATIARVWEVVSAERSVTAAATTKASDYRLVSQWLGRCPVQDLSRMREAMVWVLGQPYPTSRRKVATYLRTTARYAHRVLRLLDSDPLADFKLPKRQQQSEEVQVIPRSELSSVFLALAQRREGGTDWLPYAEMQLQTGLRTGELFGLLWSDIDATTNTLLVHQNLTTQGLKNSTKTNRARKVPLNRAALHAIEKVSGHDPKFIFPASRVSYGSFFGDRMARAQDAGLISRRYRPYDLRHTAISLWLEAGVPVAQCARWAGNSSEVIMRHYAGVTQDYTIPEL